MTTQLIEEIMQSLANVGIICCFGNLCPHNTGDEDKKKLVRSSLERVAKEARIEALEAVESGIFLEEREIERHLESGNTSWNKAKKMIDSQKANLLERLKKNV